MLLQATGNNKCVLCDGQSELGDKHWVIELVVKSITQKRSYQANLSKVFVYVLTSICDLGNIRTLSEQRVQDRDFIRDVGLDSIFMCIYIRAEGTPRGWYFMKFI